jgi:hypothetical protein
MSELLRRQASSRDKWMKAIEDIEVNNDFLTYTPRSEQELFAELHMMRAVYRFRTPWLAEDAWRSAFLVQGALLFEKSTRQHFFSVRAYRCAVLLWPAEQRELNLFVRAEAATCLQWSTCFDFDHWEVWETKVQSPLALMLEERNIVRISASFEMSIYCSALQQIPTKCSVAGPSGVMPVGGSML